MPVSSYPIRGYPGWAPFVKDTVLALAERGHSVTVLVFHPEGSCLDYTEAEDRRVRVLTYAPAPWKKSFLHRAPGLLPSLKNPAAWLELPFYAAASITSLQRACKEVRPDLIHALWYVPMGFLAALLKRTLQKPLIVTALGGDFHLPAFPFGPLLKFTASSADGNTACSRYLADHARHYGIGPSAFTVIPNGIRMDRFPPALRKWDLPLKLACVKRLVKEKNLDLVLKSLALLGADQRQNFRLCIAGEGPERKELETLTRKLGLSEAVSFEGFIPPERMPDFLSGTDVLIDPSTREGFATSNLEAMASGCLAAAASDVGNPEMIEDGVTGYLFSPRDPASLAELLKKIASDPARSGTLAQAGCLRIRESFDAEKIAEKFETLYRTLIPLNGAAARSQAHLAAIPSE